MATPVVSLPVPDVVGIAIRGFRETVSSFAIYELMFIISVLLEMVTIQYY